MTQIFKYVLMSTKNVSSVAIPKGGKVLTTAMQDGLVCIWVEVDQHAPTELRTFKIYGTGHEMLDSEHQVYVGTIFDNPYVWHVYEYTGG